MKGPTGRISSLGLHEAVYESSELCPDLSVCAHPTPPGSFCEQQKTFLLSVVHHLDPSAHDLHRGVIAQKLQTKSWKTGMKTPQ